MEIALGNTKAVNKNYTRVDGCYGPSIIPFVRQAIQYIHSCIKQSYKKEKKKHHFNICSWYVLVCLWLVSILFPEFKFVFSFLLQHCPTRLLMSAYKYESNIEIDNGFVCVFQYIIRKYRAHLFSDIFTDNNFFLNIHILNILFYCRS